MTAIQIGPYRLGKTLGLGAFSKVKLAIHELTGEKVAIKILNRKKLKKMDMGAKVRREIEILKMFDHPHIIRLYEVIDTPSDIYCVMEYIEGGEMFDYIVTKGRLDEDEARMFFQQVVSGIEYCHFHMVVHRDLKPENILLDNETSLKIADFGLSNIMKDGQFLKTSCGSPNYAAPEVISGSLYAGPEVDVWSCGVILYAILCGSLPFDDQNIRSLFRKIKEGVLNIPSYLSEDARNLIQQMLIVDPMKRIKISEIRQNRWFAKNLPAYLAISAEQRIERAHEIDESVVDDVVALGYERNAILSAIKMGTDLLSNKKYGEYTDFRQMAVAYHILQDKKRKLERHGTYGIEILPNTGKRLTVNNIAPAVETIAADHTLTPAVIPADASTNQLKNRNAVARRRWYLGLWSGLEPSTIMKELCRVLMSHGFHWKVLTPFKLKARFIFPNSQESIKFGFQLYRVKSVCMIDVQKLHGHLFPFMDLCAAIVADIRLSPSAVPDAGDAFDRPIEVGSKPLLTPTSSLPRVESATGFSKLAYGTTGGKVKDVE